MQLVLSFVGNLVSRLNRNLGIRGRDWSLLSLMFIQVFLGMSLNISLRSLNSGLLLSAFSREVYPWYFLAESVLSFILSLGYSRYVAGKVSRKVESLGFLVVFAALLLGGRLLLELGYRWIYFALPVYCEAIAAILLIQTWGLFTDCLDSRKARQIFPLVGLGGTCGAVFGGWMVARLAGVMGTPNLLFVELLVLLGMGGNLLLLLRHVRDEYSQELEQRLDHVREGAQNLGQKLLQMVKPVLANRLLLLVVLITLCVRIASTIMDYQLQLQLKESFTINSITAYMGNFYAMTFLATLVMQLLVEKRIINAFGVVGGMASTPLTLGLGLYSFIFLPSLLTATLTKFLEQITRSSMFKTAVELVYIPFDSATRRRLRLLANGIISLSTVPLVSLTMLIFANQTEFLSILALFFALTAIMLSILLQKPYTLKLHEALMRRQLRMSNEPQVLRLSLDTLTQYFSQADADLVRFVLELLKDRQVQLPPEKIRHLIFHDDPHVREAALMILGRSGNVEDIQLVVDTLTHDDNPGVRRACFQVLRALGSDEQNEVALVFLQDPDLDVQAESLIFLFTQGGIEGILAGAEVLRDWTCSQEPQRLCKLAYVIGEIGIRYLRQDFLQLLHHPEPEVQKAALEAARKSLPLKLVPELMPLLAQPKQAHLVRQALKKLPAEEMIPLCMADLRTYWPDRIRLMELIRLMGSFNHPLAIHALMEVFAEPDIYIKHQVLQELHSLRRESEIDLSPYQTQISTQVNREFYYAYSYYLLLKLMRENPQGGERMRFLQAEVQNRIRFAQEMLFKLLGLLHPSRQMEQAWLNYCSADTRYRALSLEVLSYTLEPRLLELVMTLLDDVSYIQKVNTGREHGLIDESIGDQWWQSAVVVEDLWLRQLSQWCQHHAQPTKEEQRLFQILDRMFLLKQTSLFASFSAEQLHPVAQSASEMYVPAQSVIFKQGQPGDAFYIINSGRVQVERKGHQVTVLGEKEGFGELEILTAAPRIATIRTLSECELLRISREDFVDLVEEYPGFSRSLLEVLSARLTDHVLKVGATQPLSESQLP